MKRKISSEKTRLFLYFYFIALLGSILLSLPQAYKNGIPVNYIDALFTSVSAICVTGLSTLSMDVFSRTGLIVGSAVACIVTFVGNKILVRSH